MRSIGYMGLLALLPLASCGPQGQDGAGRTLHVSLGKMVNTLDPALAADTTSQYMVAAFYDTPLQYDYEARPYTLEPSMLAGMPECSPDMKRFKCVLRDDLYFQEAACFKGLPKEARKVRAGDMVFSILRLADARLKSSGYWTLRDKLKGVEEFREATAKASPADLSAYDKGCEGLKAVDERTFVIELSAPDPRMAYSLAMPYFSAVSRRAVEFYGASFADNPAGSGPFKLSEWRKDYSITLIRNPEYRRELFPGAADAADRSRSLPLLDKIVCYLVKQPLAGWLMFLQGELDYCALDGENFDAVVGADGRLVESLAGRGISMAQAPEFQTNYIGFNFSDPLLGSNENLRKAVCLAFDKGLRVKHSNNRLLPAYGPVPPGAAGHVEGFKGPYGVMDVEKAKEFMRLAGYPDGIDPKTGKPLELSFDQAGSDSYYRQLAELMASDMKRIGIVVKPFFNSRPRFIQRITQGQTQLFRFSWTGDYPDAENFLQLFYGPNGGTCNRAFYKDAGFDRMYEGIRAMPDCPERTRRYEDMTKRLAESCPWIFESHPLSFMLAHRWLRNYRPHDFGFNRWKYLSVDPALRERSKLEFSPLRMDELRH